jgi:hypothetical protein
VIFQRSTAMENNMPHVIIGYRKRTERHEPHRVPMLMYRKHKEGKYQPHEGKQEVERRQRQQAALKR